MGKGQRWRGRALSEAVPPLICGRSPLPRGVGETRGGAAEGCAQPAMACARQVRVRPADPAWRTVCAAHRTHAHGHIWDRKVGRSSLPPRGDVRGRLELPWSLPVSIYLCTLGFMCVVSLSSFRLMSWSWSRAVACAFSLLSQRAQQHAEKRDGGRTAIGSAR